MQMKWAVPFGVIGRSVPIIDKRFNFKLQSLVHVSKFTVGSQIYVFIYIPNVGKRGKSQFIGIEQLLERNL